MCVLNSGAKLQHLSEFAKLKGILLKVMPSLILTRISNSVIVAQTQSIFMIPDADKILPFDSEKIICLIFTAVTFLFYRDYL